MKTTLPYLMLIISECVYSNNIDTISIQSKITDVTVFFSGAQITRVSQLKLNKGKYLLTSDKLPHDINAKSIQVSTPENCKILSVKHLMHFQVKPEESAAELAIEVKIEKHELRIKVIRNILAVFKLEERLLLDNNKFGNRVTGTTVDQIRDAADFYRIRLNEIKQKKLNLFLESETIKETIQKLYVSLNKLNAKKNVRYSQILVVIECERNISGEMKVSYYVGAAGWEPLYDFRVDDIDKPLRIVYNANVYQSSGEDWDNVNMRLSTINPSLSGTKPDLKTWILDRRSPYKVDNFQPGAGAIKGKVTDKETGEPLPFANIIAERNGQIYGGATTDFDGFYSIKPLATGEYDLKIAYVGYNPILTRRVLVTNDAITFQNFKMHAALSSLDIVEVIGYDIPLISKDKTQSGSTVTRNDIRRMPSRTALGVEASVGGIFREYERRYKVIEDRQIKTINYISNSIKTNVANLEYTIDIPYSIPSDGEDYSIKIKEVSLPVTYIYHAVPKLESDAFLTAEIPEWEELNLLSGKSSIYYRGTFTGESFLDVNTTDDTLNISLGRDNNIMVKRDGDKKVNDKQFAGNNIKETIGWEIKIKNNKHSAVTIIIHDQFPVARRKSISVDLLESSNAEVNKKTGQLKWRLLLQENEKKVITFKYSVKYSKYLRLAIE